jgi:uncharacterized protein (TIGR03083 family)
MTSSPDLPVVESEALMATLADVAPDTTTACAGWTVRNVVAHFAAGTKELADLIELKLNHNRERPTLGFDEREAPFLALDDNSLSRALTAQSTRMQGAVAMLADTDDPTFLFTGRYFTVAQLATHMRSEATLHRWDIVGDDDISEQLLVQPELSRHAVDLLNTLPVLYEAPEWRAKHAGVTKELRIVLRSPHTADVVYTHAATGACFTIEEDAATGDAVVNTDVANRYLSIWGRRSADRPVTIDTHTVSPAVVEAVLWGAGTPWAPQRPRT